MWDSVEVKDALTAKIALVNGSLAVLHTTDLPDQLDIKDLQLHSIVKKHLAHREFASRKSAWKTQKEHEMRMKYFKELNLNRLALSISLGDSELDCQAKTFFCMSIYMYSDMILQLPSEFKPTVSIVGIDTKYLQQEQDRELEEEQLGKHLLCECNSQPERTEHLRPRRDRNDPSFAWCTLYYKLKDIGFMLSNYVDHSSGGPDWSFLQDWGLQATLDTTNDSLDNLQLGGPRLKAGDPTMPTIIQDHLTHPQFTKRSSAWRVETIRRLTSESEAHLEEMRRGLAAYTDDEDMCLGFREHIYKHEYRLHRLAELVSRSEQAAFRR